MSRPLTPEGYTDEEWEAMERCASVLDFATMYPEKPRQLREIGVEVPIVEHQYRSSQDGYRRHIKVRVPTMTYVIRCGAFVKIGATSDVRSRLRQLEAVNPFELTVVAVLAGGQTVERKLHKRFCDLRHRDEWFREEGDLAEWIKEGCPL